MTRKQIVFEQTNMPTEVRLIASGFSRPIQIQVPKDFAEYIVEIFEIDQCAQRCLKKIETPNERTT